MQDKSGFLDLAEYVLVLHRAGEYANKHNPVAPGQEMPQNALLQERGFLPAGNARYAGTELPPSGSYIDWIPRPILVRERT